MALPVAHEPLNRCLVTPRGAHAPDQGRDNCAEKTYPDSWIEAKERLIVPGRDPPRRPPGKETTALKTDHENRNQSTQEQERELGTIGDDDGT